MTNGPFDLYREVIAMADIPLRTQRRIGASHSLLDSYQIRIMLSLIVSLGLIILLFRLPIEAPPLRVGWSYAASQEIISIDHVEEQPVDGRGQNEGALITQHEHVQNEEPEDEEDGAEGEALTDDSESGLSTVALRRLQGLLSTTDRSPYVRGGMGSLYMRIQYPEAARREGIEGRVVLTFVVEEDGTTSNIEVVESLHPLTDSSAVRALRNTEFVPGQQDGEPIRVRMQLPIRFSLLDAPEDENTAASELANVDNNSSPEN